MREVSHGNGSGGNGSDGNGKSERPFEVEFPGGNGHALDQDQEWCLVREGDTERRVRFHNYDEVYTTPGLYEYLFYDKLKCDSPSVVCSLLDEAIREASVESADLTVLDLGAGNGMVGEQLRNLGVDSVVGVDIIPEAAKAAERDRPDAYEDYYVVDMAEVPAPVRDELSDKGFNCLTTVAALGFGDIPPEAFAEAFNLVRKGGWVAFNIKDTFLADSDSSGFSDLIGRLLDENRLNLVSSRRYRHRISVAGDPLYYTAFVARKVGDVPKDWVEREVAVAD
jgi:predicted TPR repeat methyltransferase